MNSSWRRILSLLLTLALVLGLATPAFAASSSNGSKLKATWEKVSDASTLKKQLLSNKKVEEIESPSLYKDSDTVRVSIVLSKKSTLDIGYAASSIATDTQAQAYREGLKEEQKTIEQRISAQALKGQDLDVVWNITLAANIISANIKYGQIDAIKKVAGVKDVIIETQYEPAVVGTEELDPNMSVASGMTGGNQAWLEGYTGAGSAVAIVDTGIDAEHLSFDSGAFDYAISSLDSDVDLITQEEIASVLGQLNAAKAYKEQTGKDLTVSDVYIGSKIPFAFNYVDLNTNVTHLKDRNSEHGSHVAGIAAGNRYVPDGNGGYKSALDSVVTQGEAPDAQLMVMKVFGQGGGAYDSDYMVAIEDAIILGAAATNLSLGSGNPGMTNAGEYEEILNKVANSDMMLVMSSGNSYSWANSTLIGEALGTGYPYAEDKNFDTVGSPGSFTNTLAVASVNNDGVTGTYLESAGNMIFYSETSGYGNAPITTIGGTYEYVYIDSYGADIDEDTKEFTVNMFSGIDLTGKIGITNRGTSSFFVKANAIAGAGAVAAIIANNQPGVINMNLTGYNYTVPAVSITQADGELLKENATSTGTVEYAVGEETQTADVYYGTITVVAEISSVSYDSDYYTMSEFSSWGVPGNLSLKPEITAPGGNIYSVNGYHLDENGNLAGGHEDYENMSGTSMAAPQVTGISAVLAQYIRENGLDEKTGLTPRQLTTSLLMSTAEPLIEEDAGSYYSVLNQGAGLVKVDQAISSKTYIIMDDDATDSAKDGKVKAELGEVGNEFEIGFTIHNMSDEALTMYLGADFFTQDVFYYYVYDPSGKPVDTAYYQDLWTTLVDSSIEWENAISASDYGYDVNGDGTFNNKDVQDLLAYLVGNVASTNGWKLDTADVDEDGDVDTYDAYLLLDKVNSAIVDLPANGSVHIVAKVTVDDGYLDAITELFCGDYIEGYIYAIEETTEEGELGVTHSIPVIGFHGNWTESSMYDIGSYLEYAYGLETRYPYMAAAYGDSALSLQTFIYTIDGDDYYFGGNMFVTDTDEDGNPVYLPERNAVSANNAVTGLRITQTRNAAASRMMITDQTGKALLDQIGGRSYSAYYYVNGAEWRNTYATWAIEDMAEKANEGDILTYSLTLAPEYYVKDDGSIDWAALGNGATKSISAVVDNTAPEILNVASEVADGNYDVTVEVKDNQYVAAILVIDEAAYKAAATGASELSPLGVFGSDITAEAGATNTYAFQYTEEDTETPNQLMIAVYDYAGNESVYKINFDKEDQITDPEAYELQFIPDEITIVGKNIAQLEWIVDPWGIEDEEGFSISFESSDPTVATVDENGLVTAVSDVDAKCTVTAVVEFTTTVDGEDKTFTASDTCQIQILYIDKVLRGVVWDEEGQRYISEFNLNALPNYTKLSDHLKTAEIASIADDIYTGVMYGASLDTDNFVSSLYTIDPENGYALEEIGESSICYTDLAIAPGLSIDYDMDILVGTYGSYAVFIDASTGEYITAYQFDGDLVGIAYEGSAEYTDGIYYDGYFFIDADGYIHETGFIYMGGKLYWFGDNVDGNIGYSTNTDYFNSAYISLEADGSEYLYWSRFDKSENKVDIIRTEIIYVYDEEEEGYVTVLGDTIKAGSFAESVWPVGGLYEPYEEEEGSGYGSFRKTLNKPAAEKLEDCAVAEVEKIVHEPGVVKGSLNAAKAGARRVHPQAIGGSEVTPTIMANFEITADQNTHNGLVVVSYDPETMDASLISVEADMYEYKADVKSGTITFAFVNKDIIAKDEVVAKLRTFIDAEACENTIIVDTKEVNNEAGETNTEVIENHEWSDPVWTWAEDYSSATATFTCSKCDDEVVVDAEVVAEAASGDDIGKNIYTATVTFDGKTFTDTQIEDKVEAGYATYVGISLTLKGDLSMNFYINGEPDWTVDIDYEKEDAKPISIALKDCFYDDAKGAYKIVYTGIAAKEMTDKVTLAVKDKEGNQVKLIRQSTGDRMENDQVEYSVATWANNKLASAETSEAEIALAKALLNYGQSAQEYFKNYNLPDKPANPDHTYLKDEMAVPAAKFVNSALNKVIPENAADVAYKGATLVLKGATSVRLYFNEEISAKLQTEDGYSELDVKQNDTGYYVEIFSIPSKDLDEMYTFVIEKGEAEATFQYSALSWCNSKLSSDKSTEAEINLCKALYLYNQAANNRWD